VWLVGVPPKFNFFGWNESPLIGLSQEDFETLEIPKVEITTVSQIPPSQHTLLWWVFFIVFIERRRRTTTKDMQKFRIMNTILYVNHNRANAQYTNYIDNKSNQQKKVSPPFVSLKWHLGSVSNFCFREMVSLGGATIFCFNEVASRWLPTHWFLSPKTNN
jgi:hypothetical protein